MEIRRAVQADIPGLLKLLYQVGQVHHVIRPDIFRSGALKYDGAALSGLLENEQKPIFAAFEDSQMLGYCFCQWRETKASTVLTDRRELYIDDLCVEETCRGKGVASSLYRHVCGYARQSGCDFITLNVWCGNDSAMAFYEKMGLKPRHIMMEMPMEK